MNKSRTSIKINNILKQKYISSDEIVKKIEENSTELLNSVCIIDSIRMKEILNGDEVSFLEALVIMQALGESIGRLAAI